VQHGTIAQRVLAAGEAARLGRPIYWSQDAVRRAYEGILKAATNDMLKLARAGLESAIRSEADLLELLPAAPPPRRSAIPEHAEIAAA
jgi:hypothetical protein